MAKYTTQEILTAAGYRSEDVLGKFSVRIGGINVSKPTDVVNLKSNDNIEICVGADEVRFIDLMEKDSIAKKTTEIKPQILE